MTKRGLRLFYSEDEGDSSDDGNKMALATVFILLKKYIRINEACSWFPLFYSIILSQCSIMNLNYINYYFCFFTSLSFSLI